MGVTTDYIGHFDVSPPLSQAETEYLLAFRETRHCVRPDGPYPLPGNPIAESIEGRIRLEDSNTVGPGQPSFWCQWTPGWDGRCLTFDGREKFYGAVAWLEYLIDHFLAEDAAASRSGLPCFAEFTFDHLVNGIVAGNQRDTGELFLIKAEENVVTKQVLVPGVPPFDWSADLLPYEEELDQLEERRTRRRRRAEKVAHARVDREGGEG